MFTWINKQGVRSDKGFEVEFTGRFSAEYREGSRIIKVSVEDMGTRPGISFDRRAFEKWDHSNVVNSPEEQERLLRNFVSGLKFQGLEVEY